MAIEEPKYKDLKFSGKEEFDKWLNETADYKITFADDAQDFLEWYLDKRGEVLHSDQQAFVWNGSMVNVKKIKVRKYLPMQGGDFISHNVEKIELLNDVLQEDKE